MSEVSWTPPTPTPPQKKRRESIYIYVYISMRVYIYIHIHIYTYQSISTQTKKQPRKKRIPKNSTPTSADMSWIGFGKPWLLVELGRSWMRVESCKPYPLKCVVELTKGFLPKRIGLMSFFFVLSQ